jgi:hypothetical protein
MIHCNANMAVRFWQRIELRTDFSHTGKSYSQQPIILSIVHGPCGQGGMTLRYVHMLPGWEMCTDVPKDCLGNARHPLSSTTLCSRRLQSVTNDVQYGSYRASEPGGREGVREYLMSSTSINPTLKTSHRISL